MAVEEGHDLIGQDVQAHKGRQFQDNGDLHGGRHPGADKVEIAQGIGLGDGRHQAHGQRHGNYGGEVDEGGRHLGELAEEGGGLLYGIARHPQPGRHNHHIDILDQGHHQAGQGNGDGQGDNPLGQLPAALLPRIQGGTEESRTPAAIVDQKEAQARQGPDHGPKGSSGRGIFNAPPHQVMGQDQGRGRPGQLFHQLGQGRGHHGLHPLKKPPEGGHNGDEENGRGDADHGIIGPGVRQIAPCHQGAGPKEEEGGKKKPVPAKIKKERRKTRWAPW